MSSDFTYNMSVAAAMNILLSDDVTKTYRDRYIGFLIELARFHTYCALRLGHLRDDYLSRILVYEDLCADLMKDIPAGDQTELKRLRGKLRDAAESSSSVDEIAAKFEEAIGKFLYVEETEFRPRYFERSAFEATRAQYSDHLVRAFSGLLGDGQYDAALLAAFKCFEQHLAKLTRKSLDEAETAEKLINAAFAEKGALKLAGHENEQKGLRNLASGLNAVFRNRVAHKDTFNWAFDKQVELVIAVMNKQPIPPPSIYDRATAQTVLAAVAMLMRFATYLAIENNVVSETEADSLPFGTEYGDRKSSNPG